MRKVNFVKGEYYHVFNRGVDKRSIFTKPEEVLRFLKSMDEFNVAEPIGSIYEHSFLLGSSTPKSGKLNKKQKLINFIAYCLNQNHYHFILEPLVENGIQKFMHRLATGYTNYFNEGHKRSGALFQGRYKAVHINSNEYLLHASVYVNLNDKVHKGLNKKWMLHIPISSFKEYTENTSKNFCTKDIILDQFRNKKEYVAFCKDVLPQILARKEAEKELKLLFLE